MRWFLRLALTILPKEFRARHKRDLLDLYRDLYWRPGRFSHARFYVRVLTDVVITGVRARAQQVAGRRARPLDELRGAMFESILPKSDAETVLKVVEHTAQLSTF